MLNVPISMVLIQFCPLLFVLNTQQNPLARLEYFELCNARAINLMLATCREIVVAPLCIKMLQTHGHRLEWCLLDLHKDVLLDHLDLQESPHSLDGFLEKLVRLKTQR
jgi:hypothetical protein